MSFQSDIHGNTDSWLSEGGVSANYSSLQTLSVYLASFKPLHGCMTEKLSWCKLKIYITSCLKIIHNLQTVGAAVTWTVLLTSSASIGAQSQAHCSASAFYMS